MLLFIPHFSLVLIANEFFILFPSKFDTEQPYDSIPNFSAADAFRLTGIGRNEFIDIMNKCRSKVLLHLHSALLYRPSYTLDILFCFDFLLEENVRV